MRDDLTVDEIVNRNIVTDLWTVQELKKDMSKLSEQTTKDKVTDAYLYREVYGEDDNTPGQPQPVYDGLYFTPAGGVASIIIGYPYNEYYSRHNKYLQTSSDGENWTDWTEDKTVVTGTKLYVRGLDDYVRNALGPTSFFYSDNDFDARGNIMSLCNHNDGINMQCCFVNLFKDSKIITAPELPATVLDNSCYYGMFRGCTSLTTAPELPATVLNNSCYAYMFNGCTSLTTSPELPATTLASSCYRNMFQGCTSLTTPPELPATTLAQYCYMFMFDGCSALTEAPELPATTLMTSCYTNMFNNDVVLNWIKSLNINYNSSIFQKWVNNVASNGVFVMNINATYGPGSIRGVNGIPAKWLVIYYDPADDKYYIDKDKQQECDKYGNPKIELPIDEGEP